MIKGIFDELMADSKKTAKRAILDREVGNTLLQKVFIAALNPHINYWIKKIPVYEPSKETLCLDEAIDSLSALSDRTYTGHDAINYLADLLSSMNDRDAWVLERIIEGELRVGVSDSTINKVWPDLIPTMPYMRCETGSEKNLNRIAMPALIQTKADGLFINVIVVDRKVTYKTRQGRVLDLRGYCHDDFIEMSKGDNIVTHLEGVVIDDDGNILDRKTGNGIINKAQVNRGGMISNDEIDRIRFKMWDVMPYEDWINKFCAISCQRRWMDLSDRFQLTPVNDRIELIDHAYVTSLDEAQVFYEEQLAMGREGAIIKDLSGPWESKSTPSKNCVKMKDVIEADLLIVGWNEGSGQFSGMLGSLDCESSCGQLKVNISGLDNSERLLKPEDVIDKIVAVKFNEVITSKTKKTSSVFLPRVSRTMTDGVAILELRDDKTSADSLDDIIKAAKGKK